MDTGTKIMATKAKAVEPEEITPEDSIVPVYLVPLTAEEIAEREAWAAGQPERDRADVQRARQAAYQQTADPLFFGFQRGDNTEQAWLDAVQSVKDANPYPVLEDN